MGVDAAGGKEVEELVKSWVLYVTQIGVSETPDTDMGGLLASFYTSVFQ